MTTDDQQSVTMIREDIDSQDVLKLNMQTISHLIKKK